MRQQPGEARILRGATRRSSARALSAKREPLNPPAATSASRERSAPGHAHTRREPHIGQRQFFESLVMQHVRTLAATERLPEGSDRKGPEPASTSAAGEIAPTRSGKRESRPLTRASSWADAARRGASLRARQISSSFRCADLTCARLASVVSGSTGACPYAARP